MPAADRAKRAALLRTQASATPPQDWFAVQRKDLERLG